VTLLRCTFVAAPRQGLQVGRGALLPVTPSFLVLQGDLLFQFEARADVASAAQRARKLVIVVRLFF
jgi:hypothetical protein